MGGRGQVGLGRIRRGWLEAKWGLRLVCRGGWGGQVDAQAGEGGAGHAGCGGAGGRQHTGWQVRLDRA